MNNNDAPIVATREPLLVANANAVIKNTYILLSMTLLFSAFTAALSMSMAVLLRKS